MTAFAFILGCVPLWTASGSGAVSRRILGTAVIGGMLAASLLAIFLIPVTFDVVERSWRASRAGARPASIRLRPRRNPLDRPSWGRRLACGGPPALLSLFLAGCTVGPNYKRPPVNVPNGYYNTPPGNAQGAQTPTALSLGDEKWWELFQDAELQKLIRAGLKNNYDVRIAASRILQAQAQVGITRANEFPNVERRTGIHQRAPRHLRLQLFPVAGAVLLDARFLGPVPARHRSRARRSAGGRMEPATGDQHAGVERRHSLFRNA